MKKIIKTSSALALLFLFTFSAYAEKPFAPNVNIKTGEISVPENYTRWATLGTWAHSKPKGEPGSHEYHVVYTQPETIDFYQKNGRFPDGAVLVKELLQAETIPMTTGPAVSHATKIKGWFVLVRDTEGRFKESKLWGDGWGWSLFNAPDSNKTVSTDYKENCVGCHLPARDLAKANAHEDDKWIYTLGYPVLNKK
ncbi:MAG: cytochrome P460 family protein [Nitrospinota bacterium]